MMILIKFFEKIGITTLYGVIMQSFALGNAFALGIYGAVSLNPNILLLGLGTYVIWTIVAMRVEHWSRQVIKAQEEAAMAEQEEFMAQIEENIRKHGENGAGLTKMDLCNGESIMTNLPEDVLQGMLDNIPKGGDEK
jgi:hypothetical protein